MQVTILTNDGRYGQFLKKGLGCEGLNCNIFTHHVGKISLELMFGPDAFLISSSSEDYVISLVMDIHARRENALIYVLGINTPAVRNLLEKGYILGIYTRPIALRNISYEVKLNIFQKKEMSQNSKFKIRDLELDISTRSVRISGTNIYLRNKEFSLLHFLMLNAGRVMSRTSILENVWDHNAEFLTNTVDVHISKLRKKIESISGNKYIHTIPCTGYIIE